MPQRPEKERFKKRVIIRVQAPEEPSKIRTRNCPLVLGTWIPLVTLLKDGKGNQALG